MARRQFEELPRLGVSLRYLLDTYQGTIDPGTKTGDVMESIKAKKHGSSVAEFWLSSKDVPNEAVGEAQMYVVYSSEYKFREELLDCLETRMKQKELPDLYVWIDFLCLNLGTLGRQLRAYDWWGEDFLNDVKKFEEVVFCWPEWEKADILSRTWCVWEIYISLVAQVQFSIALSSEQYQTLSSDLIGNFQKLVLKMKNLNIQETKSADRRMKKRILSAIIKHEDSYESFDATTLYAIREWWLRSAYECYHDEIESYVEKSSDEVLKFTRFTNSLSYLARISGNLEISTEIAKEVTDVVERHQEFPKVFPCEAAREFNNLAVIEFENNEVLGAVENGEKAISCLKDFVLSEMDKIQDETQFDGLVVERGYIATCLNNQANLYYSLQSYNLAIQKYLESIQLKTELYGPDHLLVAAGLNNLGLAYTALNDNGSAERVYRQSLKTRVRELGLESIEVAQTRHNLAEVLFKEKLYESALDEATKAAKVAIKKLGKEHEATVAYRQLQEEIRRTIDNDN